MDSPFYLIWLYPLNDSWQMAFILRSPWRFSGINCYILFRACDAIHANLNETGQTRMIGPTILKKSSRFLIRYICERERPENKPPRHKRTGYFPKEACVYKRRRQRGIKTHADSINLFFYMTFRIFIKFRNIRSSINWIFWNVQTYLTIKFFT